MFLLFIVSTLVFVSFTSIYIEQTKPVHATLYNNKLTRVLQTYDEYG